jgi:hypothetical protein
MDSKTTLSQALHRRFGVKLGHITWMEGELGPLARVGALYFRHHGSVLEVWSGRAWQEARNLRELSFLLSDAGALGQPPPEATQS